jgi:hypothetical protein
MLCDMFVTANAQLDITVTNMVTCHIVSGQFDMVVVNPNVWLPYMPAP